MKKDYNNNGFVLSDSPIFSQTEIQAARLGVDRVLAGQYNTGINPTAQTDVNNPNKMQRINQIHIADHTLYQLLTDSRIGRLAAQITGASQIKIWGSQLYYKPANSGTGGVVGFHRDTQHMPYFADGMLTAWIPLTDIKPASGPLTYIKGSHRWPLHNQFSGAQVQNVQGQRRALSAEYGDQDWHEIPALLPGGGISFHHQNTLHGSPENTADRPRCVLTLGLLTEKARFNPDAPDYGFAAMLDNEHYSPIIYQA